MGKYREVNGVPDRYIDNNKGKDVFLKEVKQLAKLDDSTILIAEYYSRMVRMYDIVKDEATSLAGKYSVSGTYEGSNPLGEACFNEPLGVTATTDGKHVYVSNYFGHFISRVNRDKNTVEIVAGIPGQEGSTESGGGPALETALNRPRLLSLDHNGHLIIPDENSKSIYRLENDPPHGDPNKGTLVKLMGGLKHSPNNVAFHPSDGTAIITTGWCLHRVKFGDSDFNSTVIGDCDNIGFQDGAPERARFRANLSAQWSPGGEVLFISDNANNRIRYMPHDLSFVSTLAGTGNFGNSPGSGDVATMYLPFGIVLMDNSLYFTQSEAYNIRKIGVYDSVDCGI